MAKIYVGATGVEIAADMQEDITGATGAVFRVQKSDGTQAEWPAVASGRELRYVTQAGDLNQSGRYHLQPHLTIGAFSGAGEPFTLAVHDLYT